MMCHIHGILRALKVAYQLFLEKLRWNYVHNLFQIEESFPTKQHASHGSARWHASLQNLAWGKHPNETQRHSYCLSSCHRTNLIPFRPLCYLTLFKRAWNGQRSQSSTVPSAHPTNACKQPQFASAELQLSTSKISSTYCYHLLPLHEVVTSERLLFHHCQALFFRHFKISQDTKRCRTSPQHVPISAWSWVKSHKRKAPSAETANAWESLVNGDFVINWDSLHWYTSDSLTKLPLQAWSREIFIWFDLMWFCKKDEIILK